MTTVVLCGFWPHVSVQVAHELLARQPGLRLLDYQARPAELSALARAAARPDGPGTIVLAPECWEPDQVRAAWREVAAEPPRIVTAVAADLLLDGLTDDTRPDPADTRSVGELVARQIEQADLVVPAGEDGDDEWEAEQVRVLLRRLAPWSQHRGLREVGRPGPGRPDPLHPVTRGLSGHALGGHEPVPEHGVVACLFRARRPFHPVRLHDALDAVLDHVLRSRGHFWLASRPELVMGWESAGSLSLGPAGGWLGGWPVEHWDTVEPDRRLAAELDWDPYYDDRHHQLFFTGIDLDPVRLHRILAGCLLSDDELARGEKHWRRMADPFTRAHPSAPAPR
jgi:G3E family GTPase